ncbi:ankyrin repeat protein, partial [Baffinella frigidus]
TPLHLACVHGRWEMVEMLIECGADVFAEDRGGRTPGDIAAAYPHLESYAVVKLLVYYGADIHALNNNNETALHIAALVGEPGVIRFLLDQGAYVD